ncbi:succinate dehydrogenase [Desulfofundulus sp. TPOSR]|uniref:succinate dehydrogenase n=1 Tax=Desulfofundulus sp. TPOSR TaxID=2714340 RepID=UPI001409F277|nr:succinate dehydrogenase [Desulfofundulus sp. TPOSR]NHM26277.1 succinate dehydrogenase [Desulfofundulus sp. TPOSR]
MTTQEKLLTRNPRADLLVDLAELVSGLLLVGFLWAHMLFVAAILLGGRTFDRLSILLDEYYLSYIGIPFIIVVALVHMVVAGRRIPNKWHEQRIILRHSKMLGHTDTWIWVFQTITGMAILVLAGIHVWMVLSGWPIRAVTSAERVQSFLWFYIVLLLVGEYHAGFGLYRQFVKWGWINRHTIGVVLKTITVIIVALGAVTLWAFMRLGGAQ